MFNVNSIATYIQQPDLINIELTEAIWTELGWTRKEHCVAKINSELILGTDFNLPKVREVQNEGGRQVSREVNKYLLSYNGLKILAASTTTAKGKAYRRHLVEVENKYNESIRNNSQPKDLSWEETLEIANEAWQRQRAFYKNTTDKPGLRNIVEFFSQTKTLDAPKAGVEAIIKFHFNVELTKGELNSLGRLCAATYRTWHNAEPERDLDYHNGSTSPYPVCIYGTEMYATIENWLTNKGHSIA